MSSIRLARALGAFGVAGALAAGALSVGASTASAVTVSTKTISTLYTCVTTVNGSSLPSTDIPVSITSAGVPSAVPQGMSVTSLPTTAVAQVSNVGYGILAADLAAAGVSDASVATDFNLGFAGSSIPMSLATAAPLGAPSSGTTTPLTLVGDVAPAGFTVPSKAGWYNVGLPGAFTMILSGTPLGAPAKMPLGTIACTLDQGAKSTLATVAILTSTGALPAKPTAFSSAKFAHTTVTTAQHAVAYVGVKTIIGGGTPTGKVVALVKGKQVGGSSLSSGRAKLTLKTLARGTYYVTFKYVGNASYKTVSKTLKLTVKRA